jgi:tetratricopeptide (TPR) repeat protein
MKKIIATLAICIGLVILAVPVFAQTPAPTAAPAAGCTDEAKIALYTEFTTFRTTNALKAYETGKKYLACSQQEDQYTAYIKKWVMAYEKESRKLKLRPLLDEKKFAEAFALGKEILAEEPENLRVLIDLGYGGYAATLLAKDLQFNADAIGYAKKAIQLIGSGKSPENWVPFKSKDDTLANLNYTVAYLSRTNPSEALPFFIKAAQYESQLKKDPFTYFFIAEGYQTGPYAKLSADYKARFEGKDETEETKLALANIGQIIDRVMDAYARAIALAGTNPQYQAKKAEWLQSLTDLYKFRHNNSDAGLSEMIAGVLSKPLPAEPTPLTTLPAAAPTSSPTSGTVNSSGTGSGAGAGASTSSAAPTAPKTTTTTSTATPKPKPRNNHRRRG